MKYLEEIGARIKARRVELEMTQEDLARLTGYTSRSSINKIELGGVDLPQSKITLIANALNVTQAYLMGWTTDEQNTPKYTNIHPIETKRIRLLGEIACGKPIYADEDKESYVQAGSDIEADFCLIARGDSMINARIMDGDIVFCRSQCIVDNGDIAAVIIGDEATLKRVYFYQEKKKLVLQAENPRYEPFVFTGEELEDIRIIGKAIAFQSDIL